MAKRAPTYFPKHINQWVEDCKYAADVFAGHYVADLGSPPLADADYFIAGGSISASTAFAATTFTMVNNKVTERYGVNVSVNAITGFTTDTVRSITVSGRDYLGQPMTETIQMLSTTAVTAVEGVKAFKWVDGIAVASSTDVAQAQTINVGTGSELGLPYRTLYAYVDFSSTAGTDQPSKSSTTGTFTAALAASLTSTSTTADTRGTIDAGITLNGTATLEVHCFVDRNNLYGNKQA